MQLRQYQTCFVFKSKSFSFTTLQLLSSDMNLFAQHLADAINKLPNFFNNTPIIIDLEKLKHEKSIDFHTFKNILSQNGMILMGLQNCNDSQQQDALQLNLAVITTKAKPDLIPQKAYLPSKIVTNPVRSGMQLYARESDLIVTSQVSPGAEIMADGHIHVYGVLRGRAIAGVSGNKKANIFCRTLDAELISIAGFYLTREDIQLQNIEGMIHITLEDDKIQINTI